MKSLFKRKGKRSKDNFRRTVLNSKQHAAPKVQSQPQESDSTVLEQTKALLETTDSVLGRAENCLMQYVKVRSSEQKKSELSEKLATAMGIFNAKLMMMRKQ